MKIGFYKKVALDNVLKNPRLYIPRLLAESGLLACFYIAMALAQDSRLNDMEGGSYVVYFMRLGTIILGFLSLIIILYINSFLMKQRKSEYGLYNVLGMEKGHIIRVLFSEYVYSDFSAYILGTGLGILMYKMCSLLICKLLRVGIIPGFYYININTVLWPIVVFAIFNLLSFLFNAISVRRLKPVDLITSKKAGEKEPKTKWIMLIIGAISLAAGYYLALSVKTPMDAFTWFFVAVFLVIVGTYFLYITGVTFLLKCLKKNKDYYYQKRHMAAVSGLLFRMKQNAVGLASIAILSTGILVMISTTVGLYSSMQDTLDSGYPSDFYISVGDGGNDDDSAIPVEEYKDDVLSTIDSLGLRVSDYRIESFLQVSYILRDNVLHTREELNGDWKNSELTSVTYLTLENYLAMSGMEAGEINLSEDEILFCRLSSDSVEAFKEPEKLTIGGKEYRIMESLTSYPIHGGMATIVNSIGIVVADENVLDEIYEAELSGYGKMASPYTERLAISFADEEALFESGADMVEAVNKSLTDKYGSDIYIDYDCKWEAQANFLGMYGAFLFLGIILGIVCLFATILIIYYKQISEGYEDRDRFQIMQKIGMEKEEVKKTIKSQLLLQFFLPLVTAGIHITVAFPMLLKLLSLLLMSNQAKAILCAIITYGVFALVYIVVYLLTSRTYYKIVR